MSKQLYLLISDDFLKIIPFLNIKSEYRNVVKVDDDAWCQEGLS